MKRETERCLLEFCVQQHARFSAPAWVESALEPQHKAVVARYLAGVEWYGHRTELHEVAEALTREKLAELCRATGFDPGRFGGLLKAHLAHAESLR